MPPARNNFLVRILIVEDNPVNLDLVMQLLEDDYELLTAEDGQSGIDVALSERPELILLDLSLPKKSGWEVCKELKETLGDEVMPIVALTANTTPEDCERCLESGMSGVMAKPASKAKLERAIQKYKS